jgi:lipocalin
MEVVYLETSFISLLVGNPSRDYLLTWNCRHLANAQILTRLEQEAQRLGWKLPRVCTPAELMGDSSDET